MPGHAPDPSQLEFSSLWDVDQVSYSPEVTVSVPSSSYPTFVNTTLYTLPSEYTTIGSPNIEGVYRIGSGNWLQFGGRYFLMNDTSSVWIKSMNDTTETLTVRLYITTDKVAY